MGALAVTLTIEELDDLVTKAVAKVVGPVRATDSEVMTREQVAELLQVNPHQVPKLVRQGLPMHLLGGTKIQRFRRSEVLAWMGQKESA